MKIKLLFMVFTALIIASCYQAPSSDSGSAGITLNINTRGLRAPAAGYDGEVRIRFFDAGKLDNIVYDIEDPNFKFEYVSAPFEKYYGAGAEYKFNGLKTIFPGQRMVYAQALPAAKIVGGKSVHIQSIKEDGTAKIHVENVPANTDLCILLEYYSSREVKSYYSPEFPPEDQKIQYFLSHAGKSSTFSVGDNASKEIEIKLLPTLVGFAPIPGDNFVKAKFSTEAEVAGYGLMDAGKFDSIFKLENGKITILVPDDSENPFFQSSGPSGDTEDGSFPDPVPPGKKWRILLVLTLSDNSDIGALSDVFEVEPGRLYDKDLNFKFYELWEPEGVEEPI